MNTLALYVHFPYCPYKCHYCDFNSYAVPFNEGREKAYKEALLSEMEARVGRLSPFRLSSVFLGGGTPSLFSPESIGSFLTRLRERVPFEPETEITLEANPKTLDEARVDGYLKAGINRISIGVQSLKDKYLSPLGRLHSGIEAKEILKILSDRRLNFNADFMFGFPGQSVNEVLEDLEEALSFSPPHLSFYHLTLEKGTRLYEEHAQGRIHLPEEETAAEMYERGRELLEADGLSLYEISNFARNRLYSRHNLAYWRYRDYLGLGAGAVSFLRQEVIGDRWFVEQGLHHAASTLHRRPVYGYRWTNPRLPEDYLNFARGAAPLPTPEVIDTAIARGEFWMMGLRLSEGVSMLHFKERFGADDFQSYEDRLRALQQKGLLNLSDNRIRLTPRGRLLANEVVMEFLMD